MVTHMRSRNGEGTIKVVRSLEELYEVIKENSTSEWGAGGDRYLLKFLYDAEKGDRKALDKLIRKLRRQYNIIVPKKVVDEFTELFY